MTVLNWKKLLLIDHYNYYYTFIVMINVIIQNIDIYANYYYYFMRNNNKFLTTLNFYYPAIHCPSMRNKYECSKSAPNMIFKQKFTILRRKTRTTPRDNDQTRQNYSTIQH